MSIGPDEYKARINRLARLAQQQGLDSIFLSSDINIDYFSGYRHHSPASLFARPFFEIVSADGSAVLLTHTFLEREMERTTVVETIRSYTKSGVAPIELIASTLRDLGSRTGRVGAELGYEHRLGMSWRDFTELQHALPSLEFVDCASTIWSLRTKKSPSEVALMNRACEITAAAFAECFAAAKAGMSEVALARIALESMIRHGAERPGFLLMSSGPENYQCLSKKPTDRILDEGDMLWIDMGAVYDGYHSDFSRAGVVGEPTAEQRAMHERILEVNRSCLAAVRVGDPVKRIAEAAEAAFGGMEMDIKIGEGRVGHGIGLMSTEPPHVALYEDTLMEEGMVMTIEPRVLRPFGIFNVEEIFVVTTDGPKLLPTAPRDLVVLGR